MSVNERSRKLVAVSLVRWASAIGTASVALAAACTSGNRSLAGDGREFEIDAGSMEAASPECGGKRCSRDLHSVVDDCTEAVLEQCSDEHGCAEGACVPACESAAASKGSIGCSFYAIPPDTLPQSETSCWAVFVANTWNTPVAVTAERGGTPLDVSRSIYRATVQGDAIAYERIEGAIPARDLGIVFLAQGEKGVNNDAHLDCPDGVEVAWRGTAVKDHKTSLYDAFHITTSMPVSAYSLFPYGGARSYLPAATLLLPTSSWDNTYVLVDGWKAKDGWPFLQIIAQQDDTEVRIRPKIDILDGVGVPGGIRGAVARWSLKRGQVLELTQHDSLAGSPIETSHPVGVFGGNQCTYLDNMPACDSLHQQIAPVKQWSSSYSAVPYESRRKGLAGSARPPEQVFWRMVGAADGTELTYDPIPPPGAPTSLASGQVATFTSEQPFRVKSQDPSHPFFLAVHMTGADTYGTLGDPDFVVTVPDDQFLDSYVFFLDHTYADSNLTVVRRKDVNGGFQEVELDCLGPVTGWHPLGTDGTTEYAWVDMTLSRAPVGNCGYGRHEAKSGAPFALYAWGVDSYASYGFPAGAGSRPTSPFSITVH